jgi:hypothetical protein
MTTRDRVALVLTGAAIPAGTIGGFTVSDAVGWYTLCGLLLVAGLLLGLQGEPPQSEEPE